MTLRPPVTLKQLLLPVSLLFTVASSCGTDPAAPPESTPPPPPPAEAGAGVEDPARAGLRDLLAELGVAWLPEEARLEITGWVNLQEGPIEVFACSPGGKTHESVLVLDCVPRGLQAGLLALGLSPGPPVAVDESGEVTPPSGDRVELTVAWTEAAGAERRARAEDWIRSGGGGGSMRRGGWIFAGSLEVEEADGSGGVSFAADHVRSLVTTYYDATSILESPDEQGGDDDAWQVHTDVVPPVGTEVTLILRAASEGETR